MAESREDSPFQDPFNPDKKKEKPGKDLDSLEKELRRVLSGSGTDPEPSKDQLPETSEEGPFFDSLPKNTDEVVFGQENIAEPAPPSDEEFWKGNVLGWPSKEEGSPKE